jgi:hypothetical protein
VTTPARLRAWVAVLITAVAGWTSAQDEGACQPIDGGGSVTVAGIGRVVFDELTTDRVRDAATFDGRVCLYVAGADVLVRTERLEVTGLAGDWRLVAGAVRVEVPGWTLDAGGLEGAAGRVRLSDVTIVGADAVGRATSMGLDLASGGLDAHGLRLATASIRLDTASASFDGELLVAERTLLVSCDCPPEEAPVRLEAAAVRFFVDAERAVLSGGVVVVGGVRWPLPEPATVDEATLASLALPVSIGPDTDVADAWRLTLLERPVAPGVEASATLRSGTAAASARAGVTVQAEAGTTDLDWTVATDRVTSDLTVARELGAGWSLRARHRFEAGAVAEPVRDASVRFAYGVGGDAAALAWSAEVGAAVALTAQTLAAGDVTGPRAGLDARLTLRSRPQPFASSVDVRAGATRYPTSGERQDWIEVQPRLTWSAGALRVGLGHVARWAAGASPFDDRVDRVAPLQRSEASASWTGATGAWRHEASLAVRYVWSDAQGGTSGRAVGLEALGVRWRALGPAAGGSLELALRAEWAGRLDPWPDRDAFLRGRVAWTAGDGVEVGVRTTYGLLAEDGWREVTVFGAWPIEAGPAWTWRPYLAVDLLALAGEGGPWLRGHGVDVTWVTCCGTVEAGYRNDDVEGSRTSVSVRLPVYPLDPERLADGPTAP